MLTQVLQALSLPASGFFYEHVFLAGAAFATLRLLKDPDTELSVKSSLALFAEERFSQTFLTLLLKRFLPLFMEHS